MRSLSEIIQRAEELERQDNTTHATLATLIRDLGIYTLQLRTDVKNLKAQEPR